MALSLTQEIPNKVGAGVLTLGSTDGADSNDPYAGYWAGVDHLTLPAGQSWTFRRTVTVAAAPSILSWVADMRRSSVGDGPFMQAYGPSASRLHVNRQPAGAKFYTTDAAGTDAVTTEVALPGFDGASWTESQIDVANQRVRARMSNSAANDRGSVVWEAWSAWVAVAQPIKALAGSHSLFVYGDAGSASDLYHIDFEVDGVDMSADLDGWVGHSPAGAGYKSRAVDANELQYSGGGDYSQWPADATPVVQKDSGGYTVLQVFRVYELVGWLALWGAESAQHDGLKVGTYPSGHANAGRLYAQMRGAGSTVGGASTVSGSGFDHADGELHCVVARFDGDGQSVSIQTDLAAMETTTILQTMGAVTHTAPRTWTVGYGVTLGSPGGVRREIVWDYALSDAQIAALIPAALAGGI